jgi:hypothetical protein
MTDNRAHSKKACLQAISWEILKKVVPNVQIVLIGTANCLSIEDKKLSYAKVPIQIRGLNNVQEATFSRWCLQGL